MSPGLLPTETVAAYFGAMDWLLEVIASDEVGVSWNEPSALNRYTTGGVAAHAVQGGVLRLEELLREPEPADRRRVEVAEFFGPNRMEDPDDDDPLFEVLRAGAEKIAEKGRDALLEKCARSVAGLKESLPHAAADRAVPLLRVPDGQVALSEYLRTRILEVVVHGDDIVASVDGWLVVDEPPEGAVEVCLGLCLELAGARSGGMGALRSFTRTERADFGALRVL
jgi:hypothetical protein